MDKIKLAKTVISTVVGLGASKVVAQVIANNTHPEDMKDKIMLFAGAAAIGGMVSDAAKKYTDKSVDQVVDLYHQQIKPKFQK